MTSLAKKTVLITGAAQGIGRLLALGAAERGSRLVLWDVQRSALQSVRRELDSRGHSAHDYVVDLRNADAVSFTAKRVLRDVGPVDVLINNAGVVSGKALLDATDEDIRRTFEVNTLALFWTSRAFLPSMISRGSGHIVTMASAGGLVGTAKLTDYCASKFAAVGFDDSLRLELRRLEMPDVRTTVVCPFYIDTGMFAGVKTRFPFLLPILEPERVADATLNAIEANRERLVLPPFVLSSFLVRLLPVRTYDWLMTFLGINASMDEFTGHSPPAAHERASA